MNELISKSDKEFLSSILQKDNERIYAEMEGAQEDVVFGVVFEGGGFRITRYRCLNGKTYFRLSGGGMMLDENDEEGWEHYEQAPTASFEGALAELTIGKDLLALRPSVVDDDFREQVRTYIEALLGKLASEDRVRMGGYLAQNADEWLNRIRNRN
jgi:hypothetical protein